MAQQRLRPGTWRLTEDNTANDKVQIDWTFFEIPKNTSITFDVQNMALYDDAHVVALRVPPEPRAIVGNIGQVQYSQQPVEGWVLDLWDKWSYWRGKSGIVPPRWVRFLDG